jgi:hypothetical protein
MKSLRVADQAENGTDYEAEFVLRIAESIELVYRLGSKPLRLHYFRVKDVVCKLHNRLGDQADILVEEERNPEPWPA